MIHQKDVERRVVVRVHQTNYDEEKCVLYLTFYEIRRIILMRTLNNNEVPFTVMSIAHLPPRR